MFLKRKYIPIIVTIALFLAMFAAGSFRYTGFFSAGADEPFRG